MQPADGAAGDAAMDGDEVNAVLGMAPDGGEELVGCHLDHVLALMR